MYAQKRIYTFISILSVEKKHLNVDRSVMNCCMKCDSIQYKDRTHHSCCRTIGVEILNENYKL